MTARRGAGSLAILVFGVVMLVVSMTGGRGGSSERGVVVDVRERYVSSQDLERELGPARSLMADLLREDDGTTRLLVVRLDEAADPLTVLDTSVFGRPYEGDDVVVRVPEGSARFGQLDTKVDVFEGAGWFFIATGIVLFAWPGLRASIRSRGDVG